MYNTVHVLHVYVHVTTYDNFNDCSFSDLSPSPINSAGASDWYITIGSL